MSSIQFGNLTRDEVSVLVDEHIVEDGYSTFHPIEADLDKMGEYFGKMIGDLSVHLPKGLFIEMYNTVKHRFNCDKEKAIDLLTKILTIVDQAIEREY